MDIVVSQEEGQVPVTVFHLNGDLTAEEPLRSRADEAYEAGMRHLLLDLTDVPYISSAGLRVIHHLYTLLREQRTAQEAKAVGRGIASGAYKSNHLKLYNPTKNAMKALSISGYDMFLEIYEDYDEAVASFSHPSAA